MMKLLIKLIIFLLLNQLILATLKQNSKRQINTFFNEKFNNKRIVSWWNKRFITWKLVDYPNTISWNETLASFEKAFSYWANISSLKFKGFCNSDGCESRHYMPDITIEFINPNEHDTLCKHHFSQTTLAHGNSVFFNVISNVFYLILIYLAFYPGI